MNFLEVRAINSHPRVLCNYFSREFVHANIFHLCENQVLTLKYSCVTKETSFSPARCHQVARHPFPANFLRGRIAPPFSTQSLNGVVSRAGAAMPLIFMAASVSIQQYFDKRRATASSISVVGSALGMFIWPPLSQVLINYYSWRGE